jgi:hypothetical protein
VTSAIIPIAWAVEQSKITTRASVWTTSELSLRFATAAFSSTAFASCCFPPASPDWLLRLGKQKTPRRALGKSAYLLRETGAGEGIRTLDPNLGKVVLYP